MDAALLTARTARIAAVGYDYALQSKDQVDACNCCGNPRQAWEVVAKVDRYGFPLRTMRCLCGLWFSAPRLTAKATAEFYRQYYRPLVSAYHGRQIDATTLVVEQNAYAQAWGDVLEPFLKDRRYRTLLDIGGSTGVVAKRWDYQFHLTPTVVDPSPEEAAAAQQRGVRVRHGLVEDLEWYGSYDVISLCQTIDHLRDIAATLRTVEAILSTDGVVFIDIVDVDKALWRAGGNVSAVTKVDHNFGLTDATLRRYLDQAGLFVRWSHDAEDGLHTGYICQLADP